MKQLKVTLTGISPLLMHRYLGEQPSAEKCPRGKKTQDWIDKQRQKQWLEAAYWIEGVGFHVPPENIEAMLASGAKSIRMGTDFKKYVAFVEDVIPLLVSGKRANGSLESWYKPEHIDLRGVVIQKARVDRCRPIFRDWSVEFTVAYDETNITAEQVRKSLEGQSLGDFRPRFGRFSVA